MEEDKVLDKCYQHLAPIEHPDKTGIYTNTLSQCIGHKDIKNIAISGPYASGKSSIIKKYLSSNLGDDSSEKVLTISLADFRDPQSKSDGENGKEDIELRVLQQILYTVSGASLPHSRFSRIKNKKRSLLAPSLFVIWGIVTLFLALNPQVLVKHVAWSWEFVQVFLMVWYSVFCMVLGVEWLSQFFDAASFKKLSIKNLEFEREKEDQNSILSKYFDEILYFFEVRPYEIVIFEDLDRFGTSSIYTKLHELNTLLNQNSGIDRDIQFIYAIKDSMLDANDRTKFFDFIVPVLPITGPANAEDTFIRRNNALTSEENSVHRNSQNTEDDDNKGDGLKVSAQLLQSAAQFVTEPRIIHNTFNEYVIYSTAIQNTDINNEQLFSLILYKNIFVHDFDELHYGRGKLFSVLTDFENYRAKEKARLNSEVKIYEKMLSDAYQEHLGSEDELLNLYIGALYRKGITALHQNHSYISLSSLESISELMRLIPPKSKTIFFSNLNNSRQAMELGMDKLQIELHPSQSIEERIKAIKDKNQERQDLANKKLDALKKQLNLLETQKLKDLYASSDWISQRIDELYPIEEKSLVYSWQNVSLVKYLVRMGYLNEDYYLYTTVFNNESHWTEKDHRFFLKLQSRQETVFDEPLDNPREVYNRLNISEFSSSHIFNNDLLTYALTSETGDLKTRKLLNTIIECYDETGQSFLLQYLNTSNCLHTLAVALTKHWPEYLEMVFDKKPTGTEARWLIGNLKAEEVNRIPNHESLLEVLSEKTSVFIAEDNVETVQNALELIEYFYLDVSDLPSLKDTPIALEKIIKDARFEITLEAIHFVLLHFCDVSQKATTESTYQSLQHSPLSKALEKVNEEISLYVESVMLSNPENTKESEEAILSIVNNNKLSDKLRKSVIKQQEHIFDSLHQVALGAEHFFNYRKVKATWLLLEDFHDSEMIVLDDLLYFINDETVIKVLTNDNQKLQKDKISSSLKNILLNADELADNFYITLASFLIEDKLASWPKISEEKQKGIIENDKIALNTSTFEPIRHMPLCVAKLLDSDPDSYLAQKEKYPQLSSEDVSAIILVAKSKQLIEHALVTLPNHNIDSIKVENGHLSDLYLSLKNNKQSIDVISQLIERCEKSETLIKLLKKYMELSSVDEYVEMLIAVGQNLSREQLRDAFSILPQGPLKDLIDNSKRPALSKTPQNSQLLDLLVNMKILADYYDEGTQFRVRKHRKWESSYY